jgi:hypothetical protein
MKNKDAVVVTLLVIAIVLSTISIIINMSLMNEIKPYISSSPTGNVVFEITPNENNLIEGELINEAG